MSGNTEIRNWKAAQRELYHWVDNDEIPNAILLIGKSTKGSLKMALDFVQYAFCSEKSNGDICGNCPNCSKVSQLIHPDLHFSYPVVGTNKTSVDYLKQWREIIATHPYFSLYDWLQYTGVENQQGNISKNECARILKTISLKAFESGQRIICIWLPEYLQKEGNRLLKAIEEPPENTTFLFITEEPDRILNTILSRCRIVRLPALPENETVVFCRRNMILPRLLDARLSKFMMEKSMK